MTHAAYQNAFVEHPIEPILFDVVDVFAPNTIDAPMPNAFEAPAFEFLDVPMDVDLNNTIEMLEEVEAALPNLEQYIDFDGLQSESMNLGIVWALDDDGGEGLNGGALDFVVIEQQSTSFNPKFQCLQDEYLLRLNNFEHGSWATAIADVDKMFDMLHATIIAKANSKDYIIAEINHDMFK